MNLVFGFLVFDLTDSFGFKMKISLKKGGFVLLLIIEKKSL